MAGPGTAICGYLWLQGPINPLTRHLQIFHQAEDRIRIAIRPAAHRHDRTGHGSIVFGDGAMAPVGIAALVPQPVFQPQTAAVQTLMPHLAPSLTDDLGIGRQRIVGEHNRRPGEVVPEQAAAHMVDVIGA